VTGAAWLCVGVGPAWQKHHRPETAWRGGARRLQLAQPLTSTATPSPRHPHSLPARQRAARSQLDARRRQRAQAATQIQAKVRGMALAQG
jgi:hypothetical protein